MVQFHIVPLEITCFISTHGFFGGESNFITPKYQHHLVNWLLQFTLFPDRFPMHSSTLRTNPFLLLLTLIIFAIGQWFLETLSWYTITISPILKFVFLPSHFWHFCKDCIRYSFFQQDQNSLAMCWICHQCFLVYISGLKTSPGGDETVFDFMVKMFTGDKQAL